MFLLELEWWQIAILAWLSCGTIALLLAGFGKMRWFDQMKEELGESMSLPILLVTVVDHLIWVIMTIAWGPIMLLLVVMAARSDMEMEDIEDFFWSHVE